MVGRFTFCTLHDCVVVVVVLVCTPLLWTVIMTTASSSEISSVSYVQSGNGHLCLGIVPGFVGVGFFFLRQCCYFLPFCFGVQYGGCFVKCRLNNFLSYGRLNKLSFLGANSWSVASSS